MTLQSSTTRRKFITASSLAVAGSVLGPRVVHAKTGLPNSYLPEASNVDDLRASAVHAVDAAKAAGASYADIRIGEKHWLSIGISEARSLMAVPQMAAKLSFGMRVIVDGAWAFIHGATLSRDALSAAARNAVSTARGYARHAVQRVEFIPAPVVTAEWETPYEIDPFTVPLEEQTALLGAYRGAALRVRNGDGHAILSWVRERRIFASSEGSLITQTMRQGFSFFGVSGNIGMGDDRSSSVTLSLPQYESMSGGYETITSPDMQDNIKELTEQAVRYASLPRKTLDIGRYPIIFDGFAFGKAFVETVGVAMEMDRVLGHEADASGTSYLSPPLELLGTQITSPLITVTVARHLPSIAAFKWDDDGVEAREYIPIKDGHLQDYHTSRDTAPALREWYEKRGLSLHSNGCASTQDAHLPVAVNTPCLSVAHNTRSVKLEDLYSGLKRGILLLGGSDFSTDQQLTSANVAPYQRLFEINNGKLVRRIYGNNIQFSTASFWKSLLTLGDATTVQPCSTTVYKGYPWRGNRVNMVMPAGMFKEVNVVVRR